MDANANGETADSRARDFTQASAREPLVVSRSRTSSLVREDAPAAEGSDAVWFSEVSCFHTFRRQTLESQVSRKAADVHRHSVSGCRGNASNVAGDDHRLQPSMHANNLSSPASNWRQQLTLRATSHASLMYSGAWHFFGGSLIWM